jgi:hypothetical protein
MRYKYFGYVRDNNGTVLNGATIVVYLAGSSNVATIYSTYDTAVVTPIVGSQVASDADGYFEFYVDNTSYAKSQRFKLVVTYEAVISTYDYVSIEYEAVRGGETAARPTLTTDDIGFVWYDSTLERPVWWDGVEWQDSLFDFLNTSLEGISIGIPTGSKMLFYQNTAPVGWVILNTLNDKLVYITKGSVAGGRTGGTAHNTGTWSQPTHSHSVNAGTHSHGLTLPSHTHSITVPQHIHTLKDLTTTPTWGANGNVSWGDANRVSTTNPNDAVIATVFDYAETYETGYGAGTSGAWSGGAFTTSVSGSLAVTSGLSGTDSSWRPEAYCCIICEKN